MSCVCKGEGRIFYGPTDWEVCPYCSAWEDEEERWEECEDCREVGPTVQYWEDSLLCQYCADRREEEEAEYGDYWSVLFTPVEEDR